MHNTRLPQDAPSTVPVGSPRFPRATGNIPVTPSGAVDQALRELHANKDSWANLTIDDRVAILDQIKVDLQTVTGRWIVETLGAKGIRTGTFGELEEWVLVGALFRMLRVLRRSLLDIRRYGRPRIPGPVTAHPNGQVVVRVFPQTLFDRIVYQGVVGEAWMEPSVAQKDVTQQQARIYHEKPAQGKVIVVLGAGSLGMLPIGDFIYKLFVEKKVALLKVNPINDYIGPLIEEGFAALIGRGFLRVVYGGSDTGAYLCNHDAVDEVHVTGSDKTFEAILFGTGSEGASRKANRRPILNKPVTAELGNVSPVIVLPGEWDEDDVRAQAVRLASWLSYNAGCNCITPRVIIQHRNWAHRDRLLNALRDALSMLPTRMAYYPGAFDRHGAVIKMHPDAELHGEAGREHIPWTFVPDVDPKKPDDICFRTEAFYGQFCETALDAPNVPEFLDRAVKFANDKLWGNLAVTLIVHPKSLRDPQVEAATERAISQLRYGWVCLNFYPGIAYTLRELPHGAFPGNEIFDAQSGVGSVNNYLMLERIQKSVIRAPFNNLREPTLFTTKSKDFGEKLAQFEASPSMWNLSRLGWSLMRS